MSEPKSATEGQARFAGWTRVQLTEYERGILWRDGRCAGLLGSGVHRFFDPFGKIAVTVRNRREPWLPAADAQMLVDRGFGADEIEILELSDEQRAIAKTNGRYAAVLGPGVHAWWKGLVKVEVSVKNVNADGGVIDAEEAPAMFSDLAAAQYVDLADVQPGTQTVFYRNGGIAALLPPGRHAFWKTGELREFRGVDMREAVLDVNGQELLTADKLAVRMNAVLSYRVTDAVKSIGETADLRQALYREAQLALRARVCERELDSLLADRDSLSRGMAEELGARVGRYGVAVVSFGVRDVVLPGEVRALVMKTVEARKVSEAATIMRREETAALRQQLNSARMLADNPSLMRLRELETVEKLAAGGKLTVVLGEKGLADRIAGMV